MVRTAAVWCPALPAEPHPAGMARTGDSGRIVTQRWGQVNVTGAMERQHSWNTRATSLVLLMKGQPARVCVAIVLSPFQGCSFPASYPGFAPWLHSCAASRLIVGTGNPVVVPPPSRDAASVRRKKRPEYSGLWSGAWRVSGSVAWGWFAPQRRAERSRPIAWLAAAGQGL
jgi:hypothetical protein